MSRNKGAEIPDLLLFFEVLKPTYSVTNKLF